ncbi:hypothetical protein BJX70DRAFT_371104 [Aspergillus crustosus]
MTDRQFFTKWLGQVIQLPVDDHKPSTTSAWKVEAILGDKNDQLTAWQYHEPNILQERSGGAYGTLLCRNLHKISDIAVLKVVMQIPYAGSEYALPEERARQASETLSRIARMEIEPYVTLTGKNCASAPRIIQQWATEQI